MGAESGACCRRNRLLGSASVKSEAQYQAVTTLRCWWCEVGGWGRKEAERG